MRSFSKVCVWALTATVLACVAGRARAVAPGEWRHGTEADFSAGEFDSAAVTSLGEVILARQIEVLMSSDDAPAVVSDVAVAGETIYAGAGDKAVVYRVANGEADELATLEGAMIASLLWTGDALLAGTGGGEEARVYRIGADGQAEELFVSDEVSYVWAMALDPGGRLYFACGSAARVYALDTAPGGEREAAKLIYEVDEKLAKNLLCLARGADGTLYAGSDVNGLVFAIDPEAGSGRVILDADETEIAAVVPAGERGLYVATSDASKASAQGAPPSGQEAGRAQPTTSTAPATQPAPQNEQEEPEDHEPPDEPLEEMMVRGDGEDAPADADGEPGPEPVADRGDRPAASQPRIGADETIVMPVETPTTAPAPAGPAEPSPAQPPPMLVRQMMQAMSQGAAGPQMPTPPAGPQGGNAVYRIRPDGLVETVLRRPVTILAMILRDERLIIGTGNNGQVFSVGIDGDEVIQLADTDAAQITDLAAGPDETIVFATANKGSVGSLGPRFAETGTFISPAMDAGQIARWGTMRVRLQTPPAARVTVSTRSGNVSEPDDAAWSDWSDDVAADGGFMQITSPSARFLQYRLRLGSGDDRTPAVRSVLIIYQVGNLAPAISAVTVQPSAQSPNAPAPPGGPMVYRIVAIQAADANNDTLAYGVEFREVGGEKWIRVAEDVAEGMFVWDTRTVGDGDYQLRVTADDAPSNPPGTAREAVRLSDTVTVDNTPPQIRKLRADAGDDGVVSVSGTASDGASRLSAIAYSVDSQEDWRTVLPADGICDSDSEAFSFELEDLEGGAHRIAVRATDAYGNTGFAAVTVTVGK